jgi:hypothetical protein
MRGSLGWSVGTAVATAALMAGVPASVGWAAEFSEADVIAELNNTDGDLGFHALIDGDPWKLVQIRDPNGRKILQVRPSRSLGRQGMTELFFESAEPTFDELSPEEFFDRFPEGEYEITGRTIDGKMLKSTAEFTHVMPAAPVIFVNGEELPDGCDGGPTVAAANPDDVTISWDPVTTSHPGIGEPDVEIELELYQVAVSRENEPALDFTADLPPDVTAMKLPQGLASPGDEFKVEVLVREESGNQTATESCFQVTEGADRAR